MRQRNLLKSQILSAWNTCIKRDYNSQRINSERSLQASFWSHLNRLLPKNRRLFIEPAIRFHGATGPQTLIPDIVVCNSQKIIAVIELKYTPRAAAKYQKDMRSLAAIAENRDQVEIANDRYRGSLADARTYSLAKHVMFVWGGVHALSMRVREANFAASHPCLDGCYLELHAATRPDARPSLYDR